VKNYSDCFPEDSVKLCKSAPTASSTDACVNTLTEVWWMRVETSLLHTSCQQTKLWRNDDETLKEKLTMKMVMSKCFSVGWCW